MCVSKPKIPAPTPVVERQPYKNAPSRESLGGAGFDENRRRMIAGIATSAQGVASPASTTKRVMAGGDQQLMPLLAAQASLPSTGAPSPTAPAAPVAAAQRSAPPASAKPKAGGVYVRGLGGAIRRVLA